MVLPQKARPKGETSVFSRRGAPAEKFGSVVDASSPTTVPLWRRATQQGVRRQAATRRQVSRKQAIGQSIGEKILAAFSLRKIFATIYSRLPPRKRLQFLRCYFE